MSDNPERTRGEPGLIAQSWAEACYAWRVLAEDPGRVTRYAAPWFGILFLMALPLPFLGVLDGMQRPTTSGLDFSFPAALLALSLHIALWTRSATQQDYPAGIPFTFGMREVAILVGYAALLGIPVWLWTQAIGLISSLDTRFIAVHRLAGWFGAQELMDYGFSEALQMAAAIMTALAIFATTISVKLGLLLVDLSLDRNIAFERAWKTLNWANTGRLACALVFAGLPFAAIAAGANHMPVYLGDDAIFIGFFEIMATLALFPLSAATAIVLGRMARHLRYDSATLT
ncbi:MAG: hypothetical protein AAF213_12140 [Pseudomonadota bacterium]